MGVKILAKNKRASYDYFLEEKTEAGIELQGTEVKSLRNGKVTIAEAHVTIDSNFEVWIHNMKIPQYDFGNINNHEEARKRKLLLHKDQIHRLQHKAQAGGHTIIPLSIYFKQSLVKVEIALAKGKKKHDKREAKAKQDIQRKLRQGNYDS